MCDWTKYLSFLQNITSSQICHNVPEWGRIQLAWSVVPYSFLCSVWSWYDYNLVDSDSIAAQYGLSKWIWINQYHLCLNILTHNSHTWDSFVTRNWFIVQSDSPSVMDCLSPELAYLKHGNTREIHFQEMVELQCLAIVILMFTRPWVIPKIENCRNANFVITVVPGRCHHNAILSDDNVGVMTILGFQGNEIPNTWPIFFDTTVLYMIIWHIPPQWTFCQNVIWINIPHSSPN